MSESRDLLERKMSQRTLKELEAAMDVDDIPQKLASAASTGRLPRFDLLERIVRATPITLPELIVACTRDAGFGHLVPGPVTEDEAVMIRQILTAGPEEKALIKSWLEWIRLVQLKP